MVLLSLAAKILAPKTPKDTDDSGVTVETRPKKGRKKFKNMSSASEALAASSAPGLG